MDEPTPTQYEPMTMGRSGYATTVYDSPSDVVDERWPFLIMVTGPDLALPLFVPETDLVAALNFARAIRERGYYEAMGMIDHGPKTCSQCRKKFRNMSVDGKPHVYSHLNGGVITCSKRCLLRAVRQKVAFYGPNNPPSLTPDGWPVGIDRSEIDRVLAEPTGSGACASTALALTLVLLLVASSRRRPDGGAN
jgi:hypothetical protein